MNGQESESLIELTPRRIAAYLALGGCVCVFTLAGVLKNLGVQLGDNAPAHILASLGALPETVYHALPGSPPFVFELLLRWVFLSAVIFLVLLFFNAVRSGTPTAFVSGVGGLSLGATIFTWLPLLVMALWYVLWIIATIAGFIKWILTVVVSAILLILLWSPLFYTLVTLAVVAVVAGLVWAIYSSWAEIWRLIISMQFLKLLSAIPILIGALYVLWLVWDGFLRAIVEAIARWLEYYVLPLVRALGVLVGYLILGIVILAASVFILVVLGAHIFEQFSFAKKTGRTTCAAFDAGFSFGLTMAIIFLVCSAEPAYAALVSDAWNSASPILAADFLRTFHALSPDQILVPLQGLFLHPPLPIFDVFVLVSCLFVANCSMLMGLFCGSVREPLRGLVKVTRLPVFAKLAVGGLLLGALFVVEATVGTSDS